MAECIRVRFTGSLVVLAFGVAATLLSCVALPATPPDPTHRPTSAIHVGSFNILRLVRSEGSETRWQQRRESVVDTIRMEAPQIVGLQEVKTSVRGERVVSDQLEYLRESLPEYAFAGHGDPATVPSENPILYDPTRFNLIDEGFFFFSETPDELYSATWGTDDLVFCTWVRLSEQSSGETVWVYNVHFHYLSTESKQKSAKLLVQRIATMTQSDEPVLVIGDFNAFADSIALRSLLDSGLRHAIGRSRTGSFHFSAGITLWPRIDHILVSDEFEVFDGYISYNRSETGFPSDHFPVFATVQLR